METHWEGRVRASEYLRRDVELLASARPTARAAILVDTSISIGVAVRVPPSLTEVSERQGWPILRRSTGGTGLLHRPGDLLWSLILPSEDPRVDRGFVRSYGRFGAPIVEALQWAGVDAGWAAALGLSDRFCLFGGRGEVLAVGDRALGGAAQHRTRDGLLHHGAVGAEVDRTALQALFDVPAQLLSERLTAYEECHGSGDLASVGRRALYGWAELPM